MAWATREQARTHWADARSLADDALDFLLAVSTAQCSAYAPALIVVDLVPVIPPEFQLACIYQAREVSAAGSRDAQDVIGFGDYAIRAKPLTATVKALLRPETRRKAVG